MAKMTELAGVAVPRSRVSAQGVRLGPDKACAVVRVLRRLVKPIDRSTPSTRQGLTYDSDLQLKRDRIGDVRGPPMIMTVPKGLCFRSSKFHTPIGVGRVSLTAQEEQLGCLLLGGEEDNFVIQLNAFVACLPRDNPPKKQCYMLDATTSTCFLGFSGWNPSYAGGIKGQGISNWTYRHTYDITLQEAFGYKEKIASGIGGGGINSGGVGRARRCRTRTRRGGRRREGRRREGRRRRRRRRREGRRKRIRRRRKRRNRREGGGRGERETSKGKKRKRRSRNENGEREERGRKGEGRRTRKERTYVGARSRIP
eukprot:766165-Hanusia_phi.AAC.2